MKHLVFALILSLSSISFAQSYKCAGSNGWDGLSFRVELRYMDSERPEYISYVNGDLWAHWHMNKESPMMMMNAQYFKWYNGSSTVVSYSYKTKVLKLISIDGEYPNITELQCKEK